MLHRAAISCHFVTNLHHPASRPDRISTRHPAHISSRSQPCRPPQTKYEAAIRRVEALHGAGGRQAESRDARRHREAEVGGARRADDRQHGESTEKEPAREPDRRPEREDTERAQNQSDRDYSGGGFYSEQSESISLYADATFRYEKRSFSSVSGGGLSFPCERKLAETGTWSVQMIGDDARLVLRKGAAIFRSWKTRDGGTGVQYLDGVLWSRYRM